jgi:two-component system, OmpR family, sensor histidine kinase BaeS
VRGVGWILGAVLVGLIVFQVSMQPTASDRLLLAAIFVSVALLAVGLVLIMRWRGRRSTSIRRSMTIVGLAGLAIAAVAIAFAAQQMFLSQHDLNLLLVVLVFAVATVVAFSVSVSGDLAQDLESTAAAAQQLQGGDLSARTGVARADEVGTVAAAFDEMAAVLEQRDEERSADEAARRRFLAAVGHDLRTPLASLRAAIEALEDGIAPDPERYLQSMDRDVALLSSLVDDLFLLARLDAASIGIERAPIDVTEAVDEAIEVMAPVASAANVRVELDADHRVRAVGDSVAVGRVVRNLLDNAIRFAPAGSSVVIWVGDDQGAVVRVADSGPGFDPAFVGQAFDQFTRGDPSRERSTGGAGLGLAIARGFVDGMGGSIWAEPGPGGRVAFRLPPA